MSFHISKKVTSTKTKLNNTSYIFQLNTVPPFESLFGAESTRVTLTFVFKRTDTFT